MSISSVRRTSNLNHVHPNQQRMFNLMGESLLFQTNDQMVMDIADEAFGRFPPLDDPTAEPLVVRLLAQKSGYQRGNNFHIEHENPLYHNQEHLFTIQMGSGNYGIADLHRGFAFGSITPELLQHTDLVRINFIEALGLCMLGIRRNHVVVHAACVIKGATSILLLGEAGIGKSTLAYSCVRRGYQILAEDAVHVKVHSGEIQLWGAPWKIHLMPDVKRFFPELHHLDSVVRINGELKIEVDLEKHFPGSTLTNIHAGIIILLTRTNDKPLTIEKATCEQALQAFEVNWPWEFGWNNQMESTAQKLLEGGVYRLHLNGTPEAAVNTLDTLLAMIQGNQS